MDIYSIFFYYYFFLRCLEFIDPRIIFLSTILQKKNSFIQIINFEFFNSLLEYFVIDETIKFIFCSLVHSFVQQYTILISLIHSFIHSFNAISSTENSSTMSFPRRLPQMRARRTKTPRCPRRPSPRPSSTAVSRRRRRREEERRRKRRREEKRQMSRREKRRYRPTVL